MPSQHSIRNRVHRTPVFRREGDYWAIAYDAAMLRLKNAKGLRYIEPLLRHPGRSFHVASKVFRSERQSGGQDDESGSENACPCPRGFFVEPAGAFVSSR